MKYKFLEHTADVKYQAFGKTLEEAFENAAYAMFSIIVEYDDVKPKYTEKIEVEGKDDGSLLYSFLEELLFLLDTKGFLLNKIKEIKIDGFKLHATLLGDMDLDQYELGGDIKAVTYNEMKIKKIKEEYMVQVVLDL